YYFSRGSRHTGFSRDWSSDVCSSYLRRLRRLEGPPPRFPARFLFRATRAFVFLDPLAFHPNTTDHQRPCPPHPNHSSKKYGKRRSEERRVGTECSLTVPSHCYRNAMY